MMKNDKAKRVLSIGVVVAMLGTNTAFAGSLVKKDESVYVTLNSTGEVKDRIVSDWLHTDNTDKDIVDRTTLDNIVNVKGNETPEVKDGTLVWKPENNDIFYQGTANKELPIKADIKYIFDGKEVKPEDIAGKSGNIEIKVRLTNNEAHDVNINGKNKRIYTPFTAITVVSLPIDSFKNVELSTGEMVSDGNNQIITFASIPGLKDSLDVDSDKLDLKEELCIKANVEDFKMVPIVITATPEIPDTESIRNAKDMDELVAGINKVKDAVNKLSDGTEKLAQGQNKFKENVGALKDGANSLADASTKLEDGAAKVDGGVKELGKGVSEYSANAKKFADGSVAAINGVAQISDKTGELANGLGKVVESTEQLKAGQKQITDGAAKSLEGINKLKDAKQMEIQGTEKLIGGIDGLMKLTELISKIPGADGLSLKMMEGLKEEKAGLEQAKLYGNEYMKGLSDLETGITAIKVGSEKLSGGLDALQVGQKAAANGAAKIAEGGKQLKPAAEQLKQGSKGLMEGADKLNYGAQALNNGTASLSSGMSDFTSGVKALSDGTIKLYDGATELSKGASDLNNGMKEFKNEANSKLDNTGNIDDIIKTKDEIIKLSDDYSVFTELGDDMEGSVKFIMKTDEVKKVAEEEKDVKVKEEKGGFINWVKGLFKK